MGGSQQYLTVRAQDNESQATQSISITMTTPLVFTAWRLGPSLHIYKQWIIIILIEDWEENRSPHTIELLSEIPLLPGAQLMISGWNYYRSGR